MIGQSSSIHPGLTVYTAILQSRKLSRQNFHDITSMNTQIQTAYWQLPKNDTTLKI